LRRAYDCRGLGDQMKWTRLTTGQDGIAPIIMSDPASMLIAAGLITTLRPPEICCGGEAATEVLLPIKVMLGSKWYTKYPVQLREHA